MNSFEVHVVDAFTDQLYTGNPAAVVLLTADCEDNWMQKVAAEMRHSETAFIDIRDETKPLPLRWFSPIAEVDLCGHATLASAHVLGGSRIFTTKSGELRCAPITDGFIELDFPIDPLKPIEVDQTLHDAVGDIDVREAFITESGKVLAVVNSVNEVKDFVPNLPAINQLPAGRLTLTAKSDKENVDFVSRYFAPRIGIDEDPVTGSAHCFLAIYWSDRLGKMELTGEQISSRAGIVKTRLNEDRVYLGGRAVTVLSGRLNG